MRGDEEQGGEIEERHFLAQGGFVLRLGDAVGLFRQIPFIDHQHTAFSGFHNFGGQFFVLQGGALGGIHQQHDHIGALDALFGAHIAVVLDRARFAVAAVDAGGVDQLIVAGLRAFADGKGNFDTVAGGAGNIGDDHALALEQAVDVGRFAGVGAADHGDAQRVAILGALSLRQLGQNRFHHRIHPAVVQGGNRENGESEGVKIYGVFIAGGVVGFVGGDEYRPVGAVQHTGDLFVHRHQPGGQVGHKNDHGSVLHGHLDLFVGAVDQHITGITGVHGSKPAGVDQLKVFIVPYGLADDAVACNALHFVHDRHTAADNPVEKG